MKNVETTNIGLSRWAALLSPLIVLAGLACGPGSVSAQRDTLGTDFVLSLALVAGHVSVGIGGDSTMLATDIHYGLEGLPQGLAISEIIWGALHMIALPGLVLSLTYGESRDVLVTYFSVQAGIGLAEIAHGIWSLLRRQELAQAGPVEELDEPSTESWTSSVSVGAAPTDGGVSISLQGSF